MCRLIDIALTNVDLPILYPEANRLSKSFQVILGIKKLDGDECVCRRFPNWSGDELVGTTNWLRKTGGDELVGDEEFATTKWSRRIDLDPLRAYGLRYKRKHVFYSQVSSFPAIKNYNNRSKLLSQISLSLFLGK